MAKLLTGTRIYGTGTVDTQLFVSGTNSATSTTTGALQVVGGVGVGGNLYVGGTIFGGIISGTASTATNSDNVKTVLSTSTSVFFPVFVDSNNATAGYEAVYSSSTFTIIPSSGNVGIGTSSPAYKLDVVGTGSIISATRADTNRADIIVTNTGGTVAFGINNAAGNWLSNGLGYYGYILGPSNASYGLQFGVGASNTAALTITPSGNVGIGTNVNNVFDQVAAQRPLVVQSLDTSTTVNGSSAAITIVNGDTTTNNTAQLNFAAITGASTNQYSSAIISAIFGARTNTQYPTGQLVFSVSSTLNYAPTEKMRITSLGGISFGASGTAYGVSGQILQSNGNAAPTWISTGSLAAANATTATHLSGGVAGQIPYQTAPGVTAFLSTGTAGDVLVSNGSSAATYNNTLRLAGATNATSTTSGALQVVGGVGVGGDLFIQGDIRTNDTLFNLINGNATTVNFAGDATTLTMGASGSGTTNVRNNLTVSGNLTVQGTTTIVDSTVTNIADPIITLGGGTGNSAPTADDNKDRGVAFKYVNNAGTTSTGFFGYDDSTGYLTYVPSATITNEVVSGTKGAMDVNLAGGTAMSIHYQSAADTTAFLAAGSSGYLLQTNGTGSAPTWVSASGVSAGSATYADQIRTLAQTASATYYPTFVDSNNATNAYELVYTTSSFVVNPATGNVGIGITTPSTKLHVQTAATGTDGIYVTSSVGGGNAYFRPNNSQGANNAIVVAGDSGIIYSSSAGQGTGAFVIAPWNSSTGGIRLDSNGNVRVAASTTATSTTTGALQVVGGVGIGGNLYVSGTTSSFIGNVGVGTTSPVATIDVRGGLAVSGWSNNNGGSAGGLEIGWDGTQGIIQSYNRAGSAFTPVALNGSINKFLTGGTERLRITANGGISFGASGTAYGTSGQVLQSNGDAAPTWVAQSTIAAGSAPLTSTYVGFGSGSNLLTGSSSLTWNGATLYVNGRLLNAGGLKTYSVQTTQQGAVNAVYEIMKVSRDNVNWSANTVYEITVYSTYYTAGGYTKYLLSYGYFNDGSLVCTYAGGSGMLRVYLGTEVSVNANCQYKPVFVDLPPYMMCTVEVRYNTTEVASVGAINSSGQVFFSNIMTASGGTGANYNGNTHLVPNGGNVGISTVNPSAKLEIGPGWSSGAGLKINYGNSSGTIEAVNFISNGGTNGVIGMQMVSAGVGDLWLGGSGGRTLTLYRDGNVGINSTAPPSKLTVEGSGTANESVARFNNQGDYASRIWLRQSSRSAYLSVSGSTGDTLATGSLPYGLLIGLSGNPSPVQFYNGTSGAVKMTIDTVGNVGIGTTTPTAKFEVSGTAGQLFSVSDSFTGTIFSVNDVSGIPSIEVIDTGLVKFAQYGGQVAINTGTVASSTASLSVYGMIYTMGTLGEIRASSEITAYYSSDRRLKENIKLIENPITIIDQIRGVTFDWTDEHMARRGGEDGYFVRKHDIGVIAQEVQAVLPELVGTREDGYLAVKYEKLVPLLIEAIKAQQKTIDSLVKDLDGVKEFINNFKNGI